MDILKAEISKKRKLLSDTNIIDSKKKYFKREDAKSIEEQEYIKKFGKTLDNLSFKVSVDGEKNNEASSSHSSELPRKEVIRRLRDRGEPITFFGESEHEAFRRLRKNEISEPEANRGLRNDFQEALDKVDQAFLQEILHLQNQSTSKKNDVKVQDDGITYEELQKLATNLGKRDKDLNTRVIISFIQFILKMWGHQLNSRSAAEKMSVKGKLACATYTQTQVYLNPLLRKLKGKTLGDDIMESLTEIVRLVLDRNYIKASDSYLELAIGNAPWPIGVTMVGIHARTGREKIFSRNVAHVMNDETQRKYLQGLKRIMTQCQIYFTTVPSKCVEYSRQQINDSD